MDHADHVALLSDGVPDTPGEWADLGAGDGAFTLALAELLPAGSMIHAIDSDPGALAELGRVGPPPVLVRDLEGGSCS